MSFSVFLALLSALAGAAVTLILDRVATRIQEERALNLLLDSVDIEVEAILETAGQRNASTSSSFEFYEPLPTDSWAAVRTSSVAWRLLRQQALYKALDQFYAKVSRANSRNDTAQKFFALSQDVADASAARVYLDNAEMLVSEPYPLILDAGRTVNAVRSAGTVR